MDVIALTRQLVDIESITGNEAAVGEAIYRELCRLGYQVKKTPVEGDRFNVFACHPEHPHPAAVFSTHMDTVPHFIPSSEDAHRVDRIGPDGALRVSGVGRVGDRQADPGTHAATSHDAADSGGHRALHAEHRPD